MRRKKSSTFNIRVQSVKSYREGMSAASIAKVHGVHRGTLHRWIARYESGKGEKGLVRKPVSGRPRKLGNLDKTNLTSIILKPASQFGFETDFWTCARPSAIARGWLDLSKTRAKIF